MKGKTARILKQGARGLLTSGNAWRLAVAMFALAMLVAMCEGVRWAKEHGRTGTEIEP